MKSSSSFSSFSARKVSIKPSGLFFTVTNRIQMTDIKIQFPHQNQFTSQCFPPSKVLLSFPIDIPPLSAFKSILLNFYLQLASPPATTPTSPFTPLLIPSHSSPKVHFNATKKKLNPQANLPKQIKI